MATTFVDYTGDGSATKQFTFPSIKEADVKVDVDGVIKSSGTHYNITSYTTTGGGNVVFTSGNIPVSPQSIRIFRDTDVDSAKATYTAGSSVKAADLNANHEQLLFAAQEEQNQTVQTADIKDGAVTSAKIQDGTIVNTDVNASAAIAGTKISPDFGSQNIVTTGTVNGATATELAALNGLTASTSELNTLDGVTSTTAELNILDGVTANATEINKLDGLTATTAELNQAAGITSGIQSQIDGKQPLDSELTELATMGSGTADALADLTQAEVQTLDGITASTSELNLLDGKSIVTSIGASPTDVQIPSAQAVNERIVELVTEVGGFVPIANETSFPTTNPDLNDGAGTIVSIKALASNLVSNGSGVATIANGAGSGNTVTINGLANSATYTAGKGILVETTTTLHTYTFHREAIDATGVTNAQTLVNDFNDRYQVSGSAPSNHPDGSALSDGDLWFDTSANVMKVYDLGNTQYDAVTSIGDFKLLTVVPDGATSGSPTFDGNIVSYDLRDGSNAAAITSVGQLIVSLNGVIQKPNSGSYSASNEGFYLEGTDGIKFCTAPPSGSNLFVTLIGSATAIGTPNDNTVTEAKLTSDAVSEAKLKVSNSPVNGYFLSAQSGDTGGLTWTNALGTNLDVKTHKVTTSTTNGNVQIEPNGTGVVEIRGAGGADGTLQLNCSAQSHGVKIKSPAHGAAATYTLTLPINIQNGYLLTTDANGQTSWTNSVPSSYLTGALPALDGSNLTGLQAGATGGNSGANAVFWENDNTVTHSYTITANKNAGTFGPITINSGVTVTVPSNSTWSII
tara:strand:+ start:826 stop:3231 length:2406 start_codon:yes stop_codon:yes gene_type:complete